jgi:hypothetical protein
MLFLSSNNGTAGMRSEIQPPGLLGGTNLKLRHCIDHSTKMPTPGRFSGLFFRQRPPIQSLFGLHDGFKKAARFEQDIAVIARPGCFFIRSTYHIGHESQENFLRLRQRPTKAKFLGGLIDQNGVSRNALYRRIEALYRKLVVAVSNI